MTIDSMKTHTCKHCENIALQAPKFLEDADDATAWLPTTPVWLTGSPLALDAIDMAVVENCVLFIELTAAYQPPSLEEEPRTSHVVLAQAWTVNRLAGWDVRMQLISEDDYKRYQGPWELGSTDLLLLDEPVLFSVFDADGDGMWPKNKHRSRQIPARQPINIHPRSPESFALARSWIDECINEHDHNNVASTPKLPLRLLHISGNCDRTKVRLVSSADIARENLQYTVLSYCWGGVQGHKTTKARIKTYSKDLELDALPKTIQDAIEVTSQLGFSYIWIDSLCIVQDDGDELQKEIAKMSSVYRNAVVTITASGAASASDGFLQERCIDEEVISNVQLCFPNNETRKVGLLKGRQYERPSTLDHWCSPSDTEQPLDQRAWTLQEHVLSARILRYSDRQLRFLCHGNTSQGSTRHVDGWTLLSLNDETFDWLYPPFLSLVEAKRIRVDGYWSQIVMGYSTRNLTDERDRVLAISGVAAGLQELCGDQFYVQELEKPLGEFTYVAGQWLDEASADLLWILQGNNFDRGYNRTCKDDGWLGPSWAWTSAKGKVFICPPNMRDDVTRVWKVELLHRELVEQSAPFGAVREAVLGISAPCVRVRLTYCAESTQHPIKMVCADDGTVLEDSKTHVTLWTDHTADKGHDRALIDATAILAVAYYRVRPWDVNIEEGRVWAVGLLLVEVPGGNGSNERRYERHGMFDIDVDGDTQRMAKYKDWIDGFVKDFVEIQ